MERNEELHHEPEGIRVKVIYTVSEWLPVRHS